MPASPIPILTDEKRQQVAEFQRRVSLAMAQIDRSVLEPSLTVRSAS